MPGFDLERLSSETLDCISEYLGDSFSLACCNKNLFYTIARMPHSSDAGKFREACRAIPPRKVSYWVVTWKLRNFASNYLGISQFLTKRARWLPEYDAINCKVIKSGIGVKLFGNIIMWSAIDKGRLDVVQGIMELGYKVIPRDLQRAAWKGRLSILKYLWESDFRHRETESESNMEDHVRMEAYVSHHAALYGHVHILHYVFDEGGMWDEVTTEYAARGGHFAALRFLHAHHCPWNWKTMGAASRAGHLDMVIFCHKMECPWEEGVTSAAAKGGNLDVLKYLMRSGCPWERQVGLEAASGGRLDMLRYVCEEYNCTVGPWVSSTRCTNIIEETKQRLSEPPLNVLVARSSHHSANTHTHTHTHTHTYFSLCSFTDVKCDRQHMLRPEEVTWMS